MNRSDYTKIKITKHTINKKSKDKLETVAVYMIGSWCGVYTPVRGIT